MNSVSILDEYMQYAEFAKASLLVLSSSSGASWPPSAKAAMLPPPRAQML